VSLFARVVAINAGVLVAAALALAFSPATVSPHVRIAEGVILGAGTLVVITVNLLLVRRVFEPLERLTALMRRVDLRDPGRRLAVDRADPEVADLCHAFNAMLDRLEQERRSSGRRALAAQEAERGRLARELHDEIGQTLTGVMLQLQGVQRAAPDELQPAIAGLREAARAGVEEVREIARGLRPHALDELGLRSALMSLAAQAPDRGGPRVRLRLAAIPALPRELELAIFRIAQEGLTNVTRHADARNVSLELAVERATLTLRVRDDGRGITAEEAAGRSMGLGGMHERALLVGGTLSVAPCAEGGTEVRLDVPIPAGGWARR
jgi:two-component system sensor histidine kinase UhpB